MATLLTRRLGTRGKLAALACILDKARDDTPVAAAKSYFGNLGAGSGVVETIASLLALQSDSLYGTLNYKVPDPKCPVRVSAAGDSPGQSFLKLSVTPQGQAAALAVARG